MGALLQQGAVRELLRASAPPPFSAVYGGHLYWASVQKALLRQQGIHVGGAATPQMHCFTVFREPVSRVASCWHAPARRLLDRS